MFPGYMLDRVYLRGSLKTTGDGFTFTLKNVVEAGTLGSVISLVLDGAELPLADITLLTPQGERKAAEISFRNPLPLRFNAEVTVQAAGTTLVPGKHSLKLAVSIMEAGRLELKIEDVI